MPQPPVRSRRRAVWRGPSRRTALPALAPSRKVAAPVSTVTALPLSGEAQRRGRRRVRPAEPSVTSRVGGAAARATVAGKTTSSHWMGAAASSLARVPAGQHVEFGRHRLAGRPEDASERGSCDRRASGGAARPSAPPRPRGPRRRSPAPRGERGWGRPGRVWRPAEGRPVPRAGSPREWRNAPERCRRAGGRAGRGPERGEVA